MPRASRLMEPTELDLLATAIGGLLGLGSQPCVMPTDNAGWCSLAQTATRHGVLPLLMELYGHTGLHPDATMLPWVGQLELQRRQISQIRRATRELATIMCGAGLEVMLLKGVTLEPYYGRWDRRVSSDVDYYLYGRAEDGARTLAGLGIASVPYYHHHSHAQLHGVLLENHYDFLDLRNHRTNKAIDTELKRLAEAEGRTRPVVGLHGVYAMTPTMNALFLMRHMAGHFAAETMTLKMLLDWTLFVRAESNNVDWELAQRKYEETGMTGFVQAVQRMACDKLGLLVNTPVAAGKPELMARIWASMSAPRRTNAHLWHEARIFVSNRWKFRLVYPNESYIGLGAGLAAARLGFKSKYQHNR